MLIIKLGKNESIERALKRYKQKVSKTKQLKNLRDRKEFTKPSVTKRKQKAKAKYVQYLRDQEQH